MAVFIGCSNASMLQEGTLESGNLEAVEKIFPHAANWKEPTVHGVYAAKNGKSVCTGCHGIDFQGNEVVPACGSCHPPYPHADEWGTSHKTYINSGNGYSECATQCHGSDMRGGLSGVDCAGCHEKFPHSTMWRSKHPSYVESISIGENLPFFNLAVGEGVQESCTRTCHNVDESFGKTCVGCHSSGVIHDSDWPLPEKHGFYVLDNGLSRCSTRCHKPDFSGGNLAPSCMSCHAPFPKPHQNANWVTRGDSAEDAGTHYRTFLSAISAGNSKPCLSCHGDDYLGGDVGRSCNECHSLSHLPNHWVGFDVHGTNYRQDRDEDSDADGTPRCFRCHGGTEIFSDSYGGVSPSEEGEAPRCYSCHPAYPHVTYRTLIGGEVQDFSWDENAPVPHVDFIQRNRVLLSGGNLNSQTLVDSLQSTCAGSAFGGCHSNGRYSTRRANNSRACLEICHTPAE